jgi:lipopolysaccharide biosynthesis protein
VRRALIYFFYDPRGQVDDYVVHALSHLRQHAEYVFVVSNSPLDRSNRHRLESCVDEVWERENVGFDVWAYKEALAEIGPVALADFDELVLANSTFFGPIGGFDELFLRMDARDDLDFWGITEHEWVAWHPYGEASGIPRHVQSHWIAVRHQVFTSPAWEQYWTTMPMIESYRQSVLDHEVRFTTYFEERGFTWAAAFPSERYGTEHPVIQNVLPMLRDGCPIVKRRIFFGTPNNAEKHAQDGRAILREMEARRYPTEMLLSNLARTAQPRALATNLGLIEILPEVDLGYDHSQPLSVVAIVHVYYPEMTDEILDRLDHLPGGYDLIVTTVDEQRRDSIEAVLERRGRAGEVRIVKSNKGRDISAFYLDCRDVLESEDYDIVVKLHSKKSPQDPPNVAESFKRHLFENLLNSPGYAANVLRLFQRYPSLGMVFPPVYHIAYPTLGRAWFSNRAPAEVEAQRLGIDTVFDDTTPLSAYGSMFIARPHTLRAITAAGYVHDDFPDDDDYGDGTLSHVLERLASYVVLDGGHHVREVMNADLAAVNYSYLEFRATAVGAKLPPLLVAQQEEIIALQRFRQRVRRRRREEKAAAAQRGLSRRALHALRGRGTRSVDN